MNLFNPVELNIIYTFYKSCTVTDLVIKILYPTKSTWKWENGGEFGEDADPRKGNLHRMEVCSAWEEDWGEATSLYASPLFDHFIYRVNGKGLCFLPYF